MKGINTPATASEKFYISSSIVNIIKYIEQNNSQKLRTTNQKTGKDYELTTNDKGQLCYYSDPKSKKIIDVGNLDFLLTKDSIQKLESFLKGEKDPAPANGTVIDEINNSRVLLGNILDSLSTPSATAKRPLNSDTIQTLGKIRKTTFTVNLMEELDISNVILAEKYLKSIYDSLESLLVNIGSDKIPRKIMTVGSVINISSVQAELNKCLTKNSVKFSYQTRPGDGKLTREISVWIEDPKHPIIASCKRN